MPHGRLSRSVDTIRKAKLGLVFDARNHRERNTVSDGYSRNHNCRAAVLRFALKVVFFGARGFRDCSGASLLEVGPRLLRLPPWGELTTPTREGEIDDPSIRLLTAMET